MARKQYDQKDCLVRHLERIKGASKQSILYIAANGLCESLFKPREPKPTHAAPGTEEKLRVLMGRCARGEELWHPKDKLDYKDVSEVSLEKLRKAMRRCSKSRQRFR